MKVIGADYQPVLIDLDCGEEFDCLEIRLDLEPIVYIPLDVIPLEIAERAEEVILEALKREFGDD